MHIVVDVNAGDSENPKLQQCRPKGSEGKMWRSRGERM
jgi:hypothetical protein